METAVGKDYTTSVELVAAGAAASAAAAAASSSSPPAAAEAAAASSAASSELALIKPLLMNSHISYKGLTEQAQRRLVADIKSIYRDPLTEQGIYYHHDEDNMNHGYAMVVGPTDTPYSDCFFLFKFEFPTMYPNYPPRVTFLTQDPKTKTRFNPNLYDNGFVCLSVLNTWKGEGWTSCQTIRSVLMVLVTVLNDKPLCNEPQIDRLHPEFTAYNDVIRYKSFEVALLGYMTQMKLPDAASGSKKKKRDTKDTKDPIVELFWPFMKQHVLRERERIMRTLRESSDSISERKIVSHFISLYNFKVSYNYEKLIENIEKWYIDNPK